MVWIQTVESALNFDVSKALRETMQSEKKNLIKRKMMRSEKSHRSQERGREVCAKCLLLTPEVPF